MSHGGAPRGWLEFSASMNPTDPPPGVRDAISGATYGTYADLDVSAAEAHLAADAGVPPASVLLTAGATEAIRLIAAAWLAHRQIVIVGPTYEEYERHARRAASAVRQVWAQPPAFDPPWPAALEALGEDGVLTVCNPNNPTGRAIGHDGIERLLRASPERTRVVIDESFAPFAADRGTARELLDAGDAVLVRSLTKVLAIPGVRVGYVVARPATIAALRAVQDPWTVGAHAIAAAQVATWTLTAEVRSCVVGWRERFLAGLRAVGLDPVPSDANFLLVRIGAEAPAVVRALAERRIAVRSCASFGLPEYLRLAVRPPPEQDVLLGALAERHASVAS